MILPWQPQMNGQPYVISNPYFRSDLWGKTNSRNCVNYDKSPLICNLKIFFTLTIFEILHGMIDGRPYYYRLSIQHRPFKHYSDVIMSLWRLKSPASRLFTQPFVQAQIKENIKAHASLAFVRDIHRWPMNSPHNGPVTRKCFHLMTSLCMIS